MVLLAVVLLALGALAAAVAYAAGREAGRAEAARELGAGLADGALLQRAVFAPAEDAVSRVAFAPGIELEDPTAPYAELPAPWRAAMREAGEALRRGGVAHVAFVHGTFVGDDPLGVGRLLRDALGDVGGAVDAWLRRSLAQKRARLLDDNAQFVTSYVALVEDALGLPCSAFAWSSENHHAGRLSGALELAHALAAAATEPGARLLVVGHSHAGQLFCLLTQLLARADGTALFLEVARERGDRVDGLDDALAALRGVGLDFVTLGTPPRYGWGRAPGYRVLHVVSHQGEGHRAIGSLLPRGGDRVQPLGVAGSDLPAARDVDRRANARLDTVLGPGHAPRTWLERARQGVRVADHGHTVLVDFGEERGGLVATWFGHGIYTQRRALLFLVRIVVERFYAEALAPARPSAPRRVVALAGARAVSIGDGALALSRRLRRARRALTAPR